MGPHVQDIEVKLKVGQDFRTSEAAALPCFAT